MRKLSMSNSEKKVMTIIWQNGGHIYFSEIMENIERQNIDWGVETVRTFIKRLTAKGFIKSEKQGVITQYSSTLSENEYLAEQANNFVKDVFNGNAKNLLVSLFGQGSLKKSDLEDLKKFWEDNKENIDE